MSMEAIIAWLVIVAILAAGIYFAPKGWRTWIFNGLSLAITVLLAMLDVATGFDWSDLVGEKYGPLVVVALAIANGGLRAITTTRVGMKRPEAPATPQDIVPLDPPAMP